MVRTRFAPSPTGFLHIGSVRTALYSWLFAKQHSGQFVLRIEDTDQERSTQASIDIILQGMDWLGLDYDEGPFYQMQRLERYQHYIEKLLSEGKAYRCNCSKERLEQLREQQMANKLKPRYDGHCRQRTVSADEPHVIRFLNPVEGSASFHDKVYGDITVSNEELDDLVIVKSDGVPTYNFAVVVDDWEMNITHVIRGDDHINNTPRQVNLLKALGAPVPEYVHLPMILGKDGKKLSKRHGAVNVLQYRDEGYLPEAVLSYLARLGWSHGDQELFSKDELISFFSCDHISRGGSTYDVEKFNWVNQHFIREKSTSELKQMLIARDAKFDSTMSEAIIELLKPRAHLLTDFEEKSGYFFESPKSYQEEACSKFINKESFSYIEAIRSELEAIEWSADGISDLLKNYTKTNDIKFPVVAQPLRIAVSGHTETPSINEVLAILGRDETFVRLDNAINYFRNIV